MWLSKIAYQTEQFLLKKCFDSMFSLEGDKMTALGPNESLTFTFIWHSPIAYKTEQLL